MRLKIIAAVLAASTFLTPVPARADPVSLIVGAISSALNAVGVSVVAQALIGQALVTGLSAVGGLLVSAALSFAVNALFAPDAPPAPRPQDVQSNVLLDEAPRYWLGGRCRVGGAGIFCETKDGNLYKLIAHGDSEATSEIATYLNDIQVTLDGSGNVTTDEFKSRGATFYKVEKRNGTGSQAALATLTSAFSEWTTDHKGAGVCDTLLTLKPVPAEDRANILNNRGILGLGEPDITRAAWFGRYYDPRNDSTQTAIGGSGSERVNDKSTWGPNLGNCALTWAAHRIDPERFANDPDDINWVSVAEQADICDETVTDAFGGTAPRYTCSMIINKDQHPNKQAEDWILASCDGVLWSDDDGKLGLFVGKYDSDPDLVLTDDDIGDIESADGEDGESLSSHYFASYTEPNFAFKATQSAVLTAPDYTDGDPVKTDGLELYQVVNHNQAYRLISAAVGRQHEKKRLAIVAGLRGLKAKQRRFIRLDLASDAALSGIYEVSPGTDSYDGLTIPLVLIRCDADRWNAVETDRPNFSVSVTVDEGIDNVDPGDMSVQSAQVVTTGGGSAVRLVATFTQPTRADLLVQIQYRKQGDTIWQEFTVRTEGGAAASAVVDDGAVYEYRWRTYTVSGKASDWAEFVSGSTRYTVTATADLTAPGDLTNTAADDGTAGQVTYEWTAPSSANYYATILYRASGSTAIFDDASPLPLQVGLPGNDDSYTESLATGDYRVWMEPSNGSGVVGTRVGPIDFTIT